MRGKKYILLKELKDKYNVSMTNIELDFFLAKMSRNQINVDELYESLLHQKHESVYHRYDHKKK